MNLIRILFVLGAVAVSVTARDANAAPFVSRADALPRKVVVGSAMANFTGSVDARVALARKLIDEAAGAARESYPGRSLDLMVFVALPTASPQTLRPSAAALSHHYYVVNSAPRDNVSVFDPIGRTVAQATTPGVLVHGIDLSYAILHWTEALKEGRALTDRFGERVGYRYSTREDTGVFWSNDPQMSIGAMIRELNLREMPAVIEEIGAAAQKARQ